MQMYLGEFEVKIDDKARLRLPSALLRQFDGMEKNGFVVNRGFEKCLTLYPKMEWERITKEINSLNLYVQKNRDFVRYFFRGASELELDASERVLLPKPLLEYIGNGKELVLFAYFNRIEIWNKNDYDNLLDSEPSEFSSLAEEVMGGGDKSE